MADNPFRTLPAVNEVLEATCLQAARGNFAHERIVEAIREELTALRSQLSQGAAIDGRNAASAIAARAVARLQDGSIARLRPVINATGVVLHTNLGRAPLAEEAARAAYDAGRGYLNLEIDLDTGKRSSRQQCIRDGICRLTGAESAVAVNNNAAATILALRALCAGKEVIVSRGQLVEIGGSFRIPDIMAVSGAILRDVGTTNITRLTDYERAIGQHTAALLRVHTSNYRLTGHTKSVALPELVQLAKKHQLVVIDDIGSGACLDFASVGLTGEPLARQSIADGADLVLFSGDKLLGGPQAGILAGKKKWIQRIEHDPFMRAVRCDKMTLAALAATLRLYQNGRAASLPVVEMLTAAPEALKKRAEALAERLRGIAGLKSVHVRQDKSFAGGGSLPGQSITTWVVEIEPAGCSDADFAKMLRTGEPSVVARLRRGKVVLDPRTVFERQESDLIAAIEKATS
jgi:L-seryl-tRNA(Ser) seleniumtransferase